jgi:short-subunit dehydrogenase
LRNELDGTGITVTCLMPGATETEFFARSGETDTKVGREEKADPADVARQGFEAMIKGEEGVITGWSNKLQVAMSKILPAHMVAEQHRKEAEPGSANR